MNDIFKTRVTVSDSNKKSEYSDHLFFIGSCFAENIGSRFQSRLFPVVVNPFGVMYNPVSVANTLTDIIDGRLITDDDLQFHNGLWQSFRLHGSFSSPHRQDVILKANEAIAEARIHLQKTETLVVTFGTSWVYSLKEDNSIVANCHKFPADRFNHFKLSPDEIAELWKEVILRLRDINPSIRLIFTISPVRHWKNGAWGNNVSKATLMLAVDQLMMSDPSIEYFPAYEIMMDELRDYRFYADDMLHPSQLAQEYIFDIFSKAYFTNEAIAFGRESHKILTTLNHRPLHGKNDNYKHLIGKTMVQIENLGKKYPSTDVTKLLNIAKTLLI